jgi:hypothetical protein
MTIKLIIKFCSVAVAIAAIVFAQLGPADWQLRPGLGWQTEHVLAYFVVTSIACLVWPRPFVVGAALMPVSMLLELLGRVLINRDWSAARVDRCPLYPQKRNMCGALRDVRFGAIAGIPPFIRSPRQRARATSAAL